MMRLVLNEAAYRDLVAGKVIQRMTSTNELVELILEDIGWARMLCAIDEAIVAQRNAALEADQEARR